MEDCSKWSCDHNPAQRSWKVENRKWFGNWGIQRECSPKRPQREKFIKTWQGGQGKSKSEDKHHVPNHKKQGAVHWLTKAFSSVEEKQGTQAAEK